MQSRGDSNIESSPRSRRTRWRMPRSTRRADRPSRRGARLASRVSAAIAADCHLTRARGPWAVVAASGHTRLPSAEARSYFDAPRPASPRFRHVEGEDWTWLHVGFVTRPSSARRFKAIGSVAGAVFTWRGGDRNTARHAAKVEHGAGGARGTIACASGSRRVSVARGRRRRMSLSFATQTRRAGAARRAAV